MVTMQLAPVSTAWPIVTSALTPLPVLSASLTTSLFPALPLARTKVSYSLELLETCQDLLQI